MKHFYSTFDSHDIFAVRQFYDVTIRLPVKLVNGLFWQNVKIEKRTINWENFDEKKNGFENLKFQIWPKAFGRQIKKRTPQVPLWAVAWRPQQITGAFGASNLKNRFQHGRHLTQNLKIQIITYSIFKCFNFKFYNFVTETFQIWQKTFENWQKNLKNLKKIPTRKHRCSSWHAAYTGGTHGCGVT